MPDRDYHYSWRTGSFRKTHSDEEATDSGEELFKEELAEQKPFNYSGMTKFTQEKTDFGESITFHVCPRSQWGAQEVETEELRMIKHPVNNVRFSDTKSDTCFDPKDCFKVLQKLQFDQMREGLSDIKWNFMVGGDGTVYEGRGWKYEADRPREFDYLSGDCIDIAYIGDDDSYDQGEDGFVTVDCERNAYAWAVYGQQDNNYVAKSFRCLRTILATSKREEFQVSKRTMVHKH